MTYAEVVVSTPIRPRAISGFEEEGPENRYSPLSLAFHYSIPPTLREKVAIGQLVQVPFGPRRLQGIVVGLPDRAPVPETRDIEEIVDPEPVLLPVQIKLARWISDYYLAPLIDCLRLMLPPGLEQRAELTVELSELANQRISEDLTPEQQRVVEFLRQEGKQRVEALEIEDLRPVVDQLARRGVIIKRWELAKPRARPRRVHFVRLIADEEKIARSIPRLGHASKQADVLEFLSRSEDPLPTLSDVCAKVSCTDAPVRALAEKGLVQITEKRALVAPLLSPRAIDRAVAAHLRRAPKQAAALAFLRDRPEPVELSQFYRDADCSSSVLRELERKGYVQRFDEEPVVILRVPPDEVVNKIVELRGAQKQVEVLNFLRARPPSVPPNPSTGLRAGSGGEEEAIWVSWVYAETGCNLSTLRDLADHGLISLEEKEVWRDPLAGRKFVLDVPPKLTPDQEAVWEVVRQQVMSDEDQSLVTRYSLPVTLLHGVTGSGKTEIYLRALDAVLKQGKQAIVLVPEISLTPQTIRRFAARFPGRIAIIHSQLSLGERYDTWRRVRAGDVDVVIGPRSALFVPLPRLGLIVIDEEHEGSYKQEMTPRYHTRQVAVKLAELAGAVVILGSATPDVVSYYRAQRGEYRLLHLPKRIMGHRRRIEEQRVSYKLQVTGYKFLSAEACYTDLPPVRIVDMREELKAGNREIFSRALQVALRETLDNNQQAILFLNRRGAATFVICRDCGHVLRCRRCEVPLTYHLHQYGIGEPQLVCHHCNRHEPVPKVCPHCGGQRIKFFGIGTQRVEAVVQKLFPQARTLRWDRDTTGGKWSHEAFLQSFIEHQADILIGTQMIAKGLDLPLVTLVGVVAADTALHLPDFWASERTFQLLTQVAGRAGRSILGGQVIIQTYTPEHYAVQMASRHDYDGFYEKELAFRREHGYPPFARLAKLVYVHQNQKRCQEEAEKLYRILDNKIARLGLAGADLIGPAPCFFGRLRGKYRWQIVARASDPQALLRDVIFPRGWRVDIDPVSTL
jgi:primosomal protein N' (replication factor Y)